MLQGKIDLTFDYYHKVSNDILLDICPLYIWFFPAIDANLARSQLGCELASIIKTEWEAEVWHWREYYDCA